jgi:hypothetical protein
MTNQSGVYVGVLRETSTHNADHFQILNPRLSKPASGTALAGGERAAICPKMKRGSNLIRSELSKVNF